MRVTDGQTDRILIARQRLHSMQRGNEELIAKNRVTKFYLILLYSTHIPSLFQFIPVLLEYKIPQKITKVAIICPRLLQIIIQTNKAPSIILQAI